MAQDRTILAIQKAELGLCALLLRRKAL